MTKNYDKAARCFGLSMVGVLLIVCWVLVGSIWNAAWAQDDCCAGDVNTALANSNSAANSASGSVAVGGAGGTSLSSANNLGNNQNITFNTQAADLGDAVGVARAPMPTASFNNTCFGSGTFGIGISGFGASGAKTYVDKDCVARMGAAFMHSLGYPDVAMEIMCSRPVIYEAAARIAKARNLENMCPGMDPSDPEYNALMLHQEREEYADDDFGQPVYFVDAFADQLSGNR